MGAANPTAAPAPSAARNGSYWRDAVARHEAPSWSRAALNLMTSAVPYVAITVAMYFSLEVSYWLTLALSIPAAGFLLRTFIVFHDCTHGSFVPSRRGNQWIGRIAGLLVFQPFANWRHNHAVHHGTAGDLDRRGQGDVLTLTVDEYLARSWRGRLGYRLFRNPVVMFGIGPIWSLMIGPRFWTKEMRPRQTHSVWLTNVALVVLLAPVWILLGPVAWLEVQMPTAILAGTGGVFLFYVQHQFEDAYWETGENWSYADAAEVLPVLHRQHRPPPRASPQHPDPELRAAARPRRERDLPRRPDPRVRRRAQGAAAEGLRPRQRSPARLERSPLDGLAAGVSWWRPKCRPR
jgi:omega-6 fatty acid desaturase (delta-12 desaturase)